jgi:hypothetical protein
MIGKFGGAIWHSVPQIYLPPITEQASTPLMHMDPLSGALTLRIDPYAGSSQPLPCIVELPQTLKVHTEVINTSGMGTTDSYPPLSTCAPHGQI